MLPNLDKQNAAIDKQKKFRRFAPVIGFSLFLLAVLGLFYFIAYLDGLKYTEEEACIDFKQLNEEIKMHDCTVHLKANPDATGQDIIDDQNMKAAERYEKFLNSKMLLPESEK